MADDTKKPPHWDQQVGVSQRTIRAELWYPRSDRDGNPDAVEVGLCDVRAADSIRITYDFDRDGWKIEQQPTVRSHDDEYTIETEEWQEVAFVKAWQLERTEAAQKDGA